MPRVALLIIAVALATPSPLAADAPYSIQLTPDSAAVRDLLLPGCSIQFSHTSNPALHKHIWELVAVSPRSSTISTLSGLPSIPILAPPFLGRMIYLSGANRECQGTLVKPPSLSSKTK